MLCYGIKDSIPDPLKEVVVYCVFCRGCNPVYVWKKMNNLTAQLPEHKHHAMKSDIRRLAVAEHGLKCELCRDWDGAKNIGTDPRWQPGKIKETLHMSCQKCERPVMNKDGWTLSAVWRAQVRC